MVVCPNPKCQREIEESIILAILSVTPPKEYEACPYCFANLEPEAPIEQKDVPEPTIDREEVMKEEATPTIKSVNSVLEKVKAGPRFLQKVKALIPSSNWSQKDKRKKTEEPKPKPLVKEEPKEVPKTEPSDKKEGDSSGCPEDFGYLANRPPDTPIPPECLVCPKMVDCMLSPKTYETS